LHDSRQNRLEAERTQLREASQRLLTGCAGRSSGALTVAGLAIEAALPRNRLYEHHADLVTEFKSAAGGGPITPNIQALQQQLAAAHDQIRKLADINATLERQVTTLAAVITEMTHEHHAGNIVALPQRRRATRPKASQADARP
jgi:hypothetical protein